MADWSEGSQEPRLSATLLAMRLLHDSDRAKSPSAHERSDLLGRWRQDLFEVPAECASDPIIPKAEALMALAIDKLISQPYIKAPLHGDLHQMNVLFDGKKASLIDWGSFRHGDPMQELAYYAYHIDFGGPEMLALKDAYGGASEADMARAASHLAIMHAERYLQTLRGMPWDRPERRPSKLAKHAEWIAQDIDLLSCLDG